MTAFQDTYIQGRILSIDPLVTISSISPTAPLGLASLAADLFGDTAAIHLLHHSWSLEVPGQEWIAEAMQSAAVKLPQASFYMLASNDLESIALGMPSIVASALLFIDERIWRPILPAPAAPRFDAAYVGRLDTMKRHELAVDIDKLLLVYGHDLEGASDAYGRVRALLPRAHFANHEVGKGAYQFLSPHDVAKLLGQATVGLCLSEVEGCMRSSMQYLMCGLPIVSTESLGGRDRYLGASYCRIVADDPTAVAAAVQELKSLRLDPHRIREHVAQILSFERYNFLLTVNRLVARKFGTDRFFPDFIPFLGALAVFKRGDELLGDVASVLSEARHESD